MVVYDITCPEKTYPKLSARVTEPYYSNDTLREGSLYNITVTPESNVDGAVDGPPTNKEGTLYMYLLF